MRGQIATPDPINSVARTSRTACGVLLRPAYRSASARLAEAKGVCTTVVRGNSCCSRLPWLSKTGRTLNPLRHRTLLPTSRRSDCTGALSEITSVSRESISSTQPTAESPVSNLRQEARQDRVEVCDKIIEVFRAKPTSDWRKLIAFSKQWGNLHESLFARLDFRIGSATELKEKSDLKKLARKLRDVHEELQGHNSVLNRFASTPESDWEAVVAAGRGSLTTDFFGHMENLIRASHDNDERRDELARVATRILMLVEAFDKVAANQNELQSAAEDFQKLLSEVSTVEEADKRIDELSSTGRLNPALMLTMAKAYSAAKDTDYTREEVKDVMAHLYFKAKESFAAQQPVAVRVLKHLLWLESPKERREAMEQAFTPGAQLSSATEDYLTSSPEELDQVISAVLAAYDSRGGGPSKMQSDTNALMNPDVIERMRTLHQELRKHFL